MFHMRYFASLKWYNITFRIQFYLVSRIFKCPLKRIFFNSSSVRIFISCHWFKGRKFSYLLRRYWHKKKWKSFFVFFGRCKRFKWTKQVWMKFGDCIIWCNSFPLIIACKLWVRKEQTIFCFVSASFCSVATLV